MMNMKKIILLAIAVVLSSGILYAESYHLRIYNCNFSSWTTDDHCGNSNHSKIHITFADNTSQEIFSRYPNSYSEATVIDRLFDKRITKIRFEAYLKEQADIYVGGCYGESLSLDKSNSITGSGCEINGVFTDSGSNSDVGMSIRFNYEISPAVTLAPHPDPIGYNDPFQLAINDNSKNFLSYSYKYQYQVSDMSGSYTSYGWLDLPSQYQSRVSPTITLSSFLPETVRNKKIWFRAVSPCSGTYASAPVAYEVLVSAPHITHNSIETTRCFDTTDGNITLTFDRELYAGETFYPLLKRTNNVTVDLNGKIDTLSISGENLFLRLNNIPAGDYILHFQGAMNNAATYTGGDTHTLNFTITNPLPVTFTTTQTGVNCFEGSDGSITLTADGGKGNYQYTIDGGATWIAFSSANTTTISSLPAGSYPVKVKDGNDCVAKEGGNEKTATVVISQPAAAIAFTEIEITDPKGYGLTNGWISVRVTGGTPYDAGAYSYEWRKESATGTVITSNITTDATNNPFTIRLDNIGKGNYFLTVKDKNYANATSNLDSCGIISYAFEVNQPDSLVASISLEKCISCNIANEYDYKNDRNGNDVPDETEDAVVKVTARGGIVGTYVYQWQKLTGSIFEDIANATGTLLSGLTEGTYKILVKDINDNAADAELLVPFPAKLQISLSATDVKCNDGNAGSVSVAATGGRGDYTYEWNTMDTTPSVGGLSSGRYFVFVRDSANCAVKGSVEVKQPSGMEITDLSVENPLCTGAANGKISVRATGGMPPYSLSWSNGMTGENITGLAAGTYALTFTDANQCTAYKDYILTDPEPFKIDLGGDITLCAGDSMVYDMTIDDVDATYRWTKVGNTVSTAPVFTVKQDGAYTLSITTSKGCTASDDVQISRSDEVLTPEFMLTSYAYTLDNVILVNTSPEKPERVEWLIPDDNTIQLVNETPEYLELIFMEPGNYVFGLRGYQGECAKTFNKSVVVENNEYGVNKNSDSQSNIVGFSIEPNPNSGRYTVRVELREAAPIMIRVVNMIQQAYPSVNMPAALNFSIPFNQALNQGVYLIILQTGQEMRTAKMIVQ
ncbi:hypothetical protein FACS189413_04740 [Bacteroidia bacterium]|nr:hypothetical protein FACS189413_04740 [Bacteroidia bacterium]